MQARALPIIFVVAGIALVALVVLFEVSFEPRLRLPGEVSQPDPQQEARFRACFEERDAIIHERAFGTIDNPDVQREFITAERTRADQACRREYPEIMIDVKRPLDIKLLDLDYRYD